MQNDIRINNNEPRMDTLAKENIAWARFSDFADPK